MTSFAALAGGRSTTHEALALGLAAELGCPEGDAPARIQALADGLPAPGSPRAQLEAVRGLVVALGPAASGTLLLPRALDGGGHPAVVVVGAIAAAARTGYAVEPVGDADGRLYVAHAELAEPLVVDPRVPERLLDARSLRVDLHWRCAHETALCLLDHAITHAERAGDLATMLAASAMRLSLPLERDAREAVAGDHARRLARLN